MSTTPDPREVTFVYRNHRGETAVRRVLPHGIRYDTTEYYPDPQWLLDGFDIDRKATRTYALASITDLRPAVLPGGEPAWSSSPEPAPGLPLLAQGQIQNLAALVAGELPAPISVTDCKPNQIPGPRHWMRDYFNRLRAEHPNWDPGLCALAARQAWVFKVISEAIERATYQWAHPRD